MPTSIPATHDWQNVKHSKTRNVITREYKENTAGTEWQTNDNEHQMATDMAGTAKTTKANTKYMTLSISKVHMAVLPTKHLSTVRLRAGQRQELTVIHVIDMDIYVNFAFPQRLNIKAQAGPSALSAFWSFFPLDGQLVLHVV